MQAVRCGSRLRFYGAIWCGLNKSETCEYGSIRFRTLEYVRYGSSKYYTVRSGAIFKDRESKDAVRCGRFDTLRCCSMVFYSLRRGLVLLSYMLRRPVGCGAVWCGAVRCDASFQRAIILRSCVVQGTVPNHTEPKRTTHRKESLLVVLSSFCRASGVACYNGNRRQGDVIRKSSPLGA